MIYIPAAVEKCRVIKMPAINDANIDGISDTNNISSVYILRINIIVTDCVGNI